MVLKFWDTLIIVCCVWYHHNVMQSDHTGVKAMASSRVDYNVVGTQLTGVSRTMASPLKVPGKLTFT